MTAISANGMCVIIMAILAGVFAIAFVKYCKKIECLKRELEQARVYPERLKLMLVEARGRAEDAERRIASGAFCAGCETLTELSCARVRIKKLEETLADEKAWGHWGCDEETCHSSGDDCPASRPGVSGYKELPFEEKFQRELVRIREVEL